MWYRQKSAQNKCSVSLGDFYCHCWLHYITLQELWLLKMILVMVATCILKDLMCLSCNYSLSQIWLLYREGWGFQSIGPVQSYQSYNTQLGKTADDVESPLRHSVSTFCLFLFLLWGLFRSRTANGGHGTLPGNGNTAWEWGHFLGTRILLGNGTLLGNGDTAWDGDTPWAWEHYLGIGTECRNGNNVWHGDTACGHCLALETLPRPGNGNMGWKWEYNRKPVFSLFFM